MALYHRLCHGNGHTLVIWLESHECLYDRPFCEWIFWKVYQNSSLLFFQATSTHKRTPCQMISFLKFFFIFFDFFQNGLKIAGTSFHSNDMNLLKLSVVLPYNDYLGTLKWFLVIFRTKLSYTCSSNLNYFREISIKSFKWEKVARKLENS